MMRRAALCTVVMLVASCERPAAVPAVDPPVVMLAVGLAGDSTASVRGAAQGPPDQLAAGAPALTRALHACEQRRFTVIDAETVEFPSSALDADMVDCVARRVGFPFDAMLFGERDGALLARPVFPRSPAIELGR